MACPSRRPSSSPPRNRWVVVGRSRTVRRSHVLSCGEGCLMTRARPSPTNASKRSDPCGHERSSCPQAKPSCWNPLVRCPGCRLYGALALRRACSVPSRGWGSVGRVVVADGCWRAARLSTLWPYTRALAVFAHVSTHGRLAWTACKRRLDSCPVSDARVSATSFFCCSPVLTRVAPTRRSYHRQARALRSS